MPDATYFRNQAATCRRLAGTILDADAKKSLETMAQEYDRQAAQLEAEATPPAPEETA